MCVYVYKFCIENEESFRGLMYRKVFALIDVDVFFFVKFNRLFNSVFSEGN